jgi:hypothetical protein
MNKDLDPRGRYDAVIATEGLFQVEQFPKGCGLLLAPYGHQTRADRCPVLG